MSKVKDTNCGCLACRAPNLFRSRDPAFHSKGWVVCPPCYDHLEEHFKNDPGPPPPPWNFGVGRTQNKEECLLAGAGCVTCGKSHRSVLESSPPEDPCDRGFMQEIST